MKTPSANNILPMFPAQGFPSLENSPLWAEDYASPRQAEQEETPPLFVIRDHYPRISTAIELQWGTPEMDAYFNNLIVDDRFGRAGFPRVVLEAILKLSSDHTKRFKFDKQSTTYDKWSADRFHHHAHR